MGAKMQCIASLPEDNVLDILHRLPTKSLYKFMCVSKKWHYLISSPSLSGSCRHVRWNHSPRTLGFFLQTWDDPYSDHIRFLTTSNEMIDLHWKLDKALNRFGDLISIAASSNGFLLYSRTELYPVDYFLCNPTTKQWVALPRPQNRYESVLIGFVCNVDNPSMDSISYKVLRFEERDFYSDSYVTMEIFSSEIGEWVTINLLPAVSFSICPIEQPAVFVEGVFYWFAWPRLIACDLVKRRLWLVKLPIEDERMISGDSTLIGLSRGSLLLGFSKCLDIEIWNLSGHSDPLNENEAWHLKYKENLFDKVYQYPEIFKGGFLDANFEFAGFDQNNAHIIFLFISRYFVSYHIISGEMEVIHTIEHQCQRSGFKFFLYDWFDWPRSLNQSLSDFGN